MKEKNKMKKIIEIFNSDVNQKISKFGVVNYSFILLEDNPKLLFYYYPMIERLVRCILDMSGVFNIMNSNQYTFKTLFSIITNNKNGINEVFGAEFGDELYEYIRRTYCPDGIRNKIMHYSVGEVELRDIQIAKQIFLKLIQFYVENYTIEDEN